MNENTRLRPSWTLKAGVSPQDCHPNCTQFAKNGKRVASCLMKWIAHALSLSGLVLLIICRPFSSQALRAMTLHKISVGAYPATAAGTWAGWLTG